MDFGMALEDLKDGHRATRRGWNGSGQWLALSPGCSDLAADRIWSPTIRGQVEGAGGQAVFRPYLMLSTVDGELVPWVASQSDLLAEDWETL